MPQPDPLEPVSATPEDCGVTRRVVLLCLLLALFFGYVIPIIDVKLGNTFLGATHLPPGAIAVLLVLLLFVNPILSAFARGARFSRKETLIVYISCLFSCLVLGHGAENAVIANLVGPFYFANRSNGWLDFLSPHLKSWFTPLWHRRATKPSKIGIRVFKLATSSFPGARGCCLCWPGAASSPLPTSCSPV